jgi:hypothetical protein
MPIQRVARFLITQDFEIAPSLGFESDRLQGCIDEINRTKVESAFASKAFSFSEDNLDFLEQVPHLRQIWFWEVKVSRIDGLYSLRNLQYLGLHDQKPGIDFSKFPLLKQVVWTYNPRDHGLKELQHLDQVDLWRFNPKSKSFVDSGIPSQLRRLDINWANPASLDGIPHMPNCKEIQIHFCRNLRSLEGLDEIAPNLEKLVIASSKNCTETRAVQNLQKLKHVFINKPARKAFEETHRK